jgi:pyruvate dehydrogenase E2 component (dihydrolipoamide acetyltransferase)
MSRNHSDSSIRVAASPRARRAMLSRGIDPQSVRGSGPGGRITEVDVARTASQPGGADMKSRGLMPTAATAAPPGDLPALTPMRRSIARVTATSAATVPQFHLRAELDAVLLLQTREQLLARAAAEGLVRLSITDLILRAMGLALHDNPAANAIWSGNTIHRLPEANVGLVVNLDDGLLIPLLRAVDRQAIFELARQRSEVVAAARGGRVSADAGQGAATSLSNLGTTRVDDFTAVIFPPQSTILTAGRIVERPFVVDGKLCSRPTLRLTLSVDHRVLDGAPAAQFLGRLVRYLEQPAMMLHPQPQPS